LKRRKDLFWLTISEVSVSGWLASLLWAEGVVDQKYSPHSNQEAERE
jgi:hypothetical protein